jgi:hypothetical protein
MGTKPRTIRHYPRMKVRGARQRRLVPIHRAWRAADALADAFARIVKASAESAASMPDMAAAALVAVDEQRDPYLEALGREEPPADVTCPVWFTWSAFGAWYMDTQCDRGVLLDLDSLSRELSCPMCDPTGFYEQHYGGGCIVPTCARCEDMLPTGTVLQWHELGNSLSASAECGPCGKRTWTLMRDYWDALGDDIPEWHPGELVAAAVE